MNLPSFSTSLRFRTCDLRTEGFGGGIGLFISLVEGMSLSNVSGIGITLVLEHSLRLVNATVGWLA